MLAAVSAPSFISAQGHPSHATTLEHVQELAAWLVDPERARPILVVTARNLHQAPYFPVDWAQALVGSVGDVVAIGPSARGALTRELEHRLPGGWMVFDGAARIYWTIAEAGRHPRAHPLVRAERGDTASEALRAKLQLRWRSGPRGRKTPGGTPPATAPDATAASPAPSAPAAAGPTEDALHLQVLQAWLALLPERESRSHFGLAPYRLHRDLIEQLEQLVPARGPVAAAAAAIASGHVWTQREPTPVRVLRDGAPVLRGRDSAVAWRYPLGDGRQCLFYWHPATGPIVLARIGGADHTALADARRHASEHRASASTSHRPAPTSAPGERPAPPANAEPAPSDERRQWRVADLGVTDDELVQALRSAAQPLAAPELREAVGIPADAPSHTVSKFLADASERGVVVRTGQRRGTRYSAPPA
jgi:hypothetical protein